MKQKPKADEFPYDESLPYHLGTGSYNIWREDRKQKVKDIKVVGFVRPKQPARVRQTKVK